MQDLIYVEQQRLEKNWVPWAGTTLMSYTNYPALAPHTVLDWSSYDDPLIQLEATSTSPAALFDKIIAHWGGWVRCVAPIRMPLVGAAGLFERILP